MHTVYEHHRIVTLKTALKPCIHLGTDAIDHPADTGLGIVLAINLVKDIPDLLLCKTFGVQDSGQPVTFLFLIAKDGKYLGMEVVVTVTRNAEFQFPSLTIGMPQTVPLPLFLGFSRRN